MWTILLFSLAALAVILWAVAIFDISRSNFEKRHHQSLWLFAVLFFPILGTAVYFTIRKDIKVKPRAFDPGFNS
ncbi:MAG: PLDc N-terminal domain-containing protein [Cyclobacteriaceae bacterium]